MHKRRKRKKIGKILLGILFVIGIGYIAYEWKDSNVETSTKTSISTEEKKEKPIESKEVQSSIFGKYYKKASILVSKMTLEEKVGQLFLVRYNSSDVEYLSNFYPGGYILFAKDFENHTKDSIQKELEKKQTLNKYPLIIGVDEEGGFVTRVSRFKAFREEKFLSPKYYYETGGYELVEKVEQEKATLLKELGINLNLAPVADISENPNDFIYNRAFGQDANSTAIYIKNMVTYANQNGINSCLKHFPGYGDNEDTHTGAAIDTRSYANFIEKDFLPFEEGIAAKVPCILVSHNRVLSMDEEYPASLSKEVIKELRDTLNFTGIIITDDLAMDAVKEYVENKEAATLAINAGNDMIITSDFISMYNEVLNSVREGKISEDTINKAVLRVIAWKCNSNLWE